MTTWSTMSKQERVAALKDGISKGLSVSGIAATVGATRSTVSGALARNGLSTVGGLGAASPEAVRRSSETRIKNNAGRFQGKPREQRASSFNSFAKNEEKRRQREAKNAEREKNKAEAARVRALGSWAPLEGSTPRPLYEVAVPRGCTWPLWKEDTEPKLYCGEPTPDRDYCYCTTHLRKAYVVLPVLNKPHIGADNENVAASLRCPDDGDTVRSVTAGREPASADA